MAKELQNHFLFWQRILTLANIITIAVGVCVAFFGNSFVFDIHNEYTASVFFNGTNPEPATLRLKSWLFGIIGGTIVGFHILMVMISENAFKKREPWAHKAMTYGLMSWFLIDTGVSLYYGAIHNVVLINLVALALIGIPLIMTRRYF